MEKYAEVYLQGLWCAIDLQRRLGAVDWPIQAEEISDHRFVLAA